ncbi:MAG TPA: nuclear transport factor 2 family protein [Solirubrobacterales bacterium]
MTNAERFMQHYLEVWPNFEADRLDEAIDPEATIHHSGMSTSIRGADEPDYVRGIKSLMPDIGLEVANWAANGDLVFIEYRMSATLAGRSLRWTGIGRFRLRGERAIDAIGRWDNLELLAQIDPTVSATAFAEAAASLVAEESSP